MGGWDEMGDCVEVGVWGEMGELKGEMEMGVWE